MRDTAYRAWTEWKTMVDVPTVNFATNEALMPNGEWYKVELMQWTGLTDKAGTRIYEGDILGKRPYGYLKSDGTKDGRYRGKEWQCFPIEWGEYDASEAGLVSGYECETDGKYAGWNINFGGYDDELKEFEVIGNIYEHPHLLEDK